MCISACGFACVCVCVYVRVSVCVSILRISGQVMEDRYEPISVLTSRHRQVTSNQRPLAQVISLTAPIAGSHKIMRPTHLPLSLSPNFHFPP